MSLWAIASTLLPAYLLGALPWSLWVARLRGSDLRALGSGNLGATNVYRQLGPGLGLLVLALDLGKGAAAVLWGSANPGAHEFPGGAGYAALAAAVTAIAGHVYTVFAGFRGGKGVATTVGAYLGLAPVATLASVAVFFAVLGATRRVSLGSIAMAVVLPFAIAALAPGPARVALVLLAAVTSTLIVLRHRENLRRLRLGTEPRFSLRGPSAGARPEGAGRERRSGPASGKGGEA